MSEISLEWFQNRRSTAKTDAPHKQKEPIYGLKRKHAYNPDTSPLLLQENKVYTQQVVGVFLHYTRAVDITIITEMKSIA